MEINRAIHLNKLNTPSFNDALCQVWLKLAKCFWRRRFLNCINIFSIFRNYLPLDKTKALHLTNLISHQPRMRCIILIEIALVVQERTFFKIHPGIFSLFRNFLPLEKVRGLHLNKPESASRNDLLCQVCLKLTQWSWRRFLNFINVFWLFRNYLPMEKGEALHLFRLESHLLTDALCQVWLKFV